MLIPLEYIDVLNPENNPESISISSNEKKKKVVFEEVK